MSSKPPQNHLETRHQSAEGFIEGAIAEAIKEADLLLASLEEQIELGFFTAQAETKIMPSNEQPSLLEDDRFPTDWF